MSVRVKKYSPALKHGGYAATALLPGENVEEFEKLFQELLTELGANGPMERDIVATIAACMWRKHHLGIYRTAEVAQRRYQEILDEMVPKPSAFRFRGMMGEPDLETIKEATEAAHGVARKELGNDIELVEAGDLATFDGLRDRLDIRQRLDAIINQCIRRLLLVRGLKSIPPAKSEAPKQLLG
jgi:hypothetical protein